MHLGILRVVTATQRGSARGGETSQIAMRTRFGADRGKNTENRHKVTRALAKGTEHRRQSEASVAYRVPSVHYGQKQVATQGEVRRPNVNRRGHPSSQLVASKSRKILFQF